MADGVIGTLRAVLTASAAEFKAGFNEALTATEKFDKGSKSLGGTIVTLNQSLELLQKGFGAIRAVASATLTAFTAPLDAANEADRAIVGLETAVKAADQVTPGFIANLEALATAQARVSGVSDETVLNVEKQLIAFKATSDQLPKLVQASLDFSTKTGDAASAAFILGRALDGETARLGQYGISIDASATRTERFDQLIEQVSTRFGGQAAAAASTYAGRIDTLKISYEELLETTGSFITRNTAVLAVVNSITASVNSLNDILEKARPQIDAIVTGFAGLAKVKLTDATDFLEATAKANNLPILATALSAVSTALRTGAGSAAQFRQELTAAQDQVERGVSGASRFEGAVEGIGPRGERSFKTLDTAIDGSKKKFETLTEQIQANPAQVAIELDNAADKLLPALNKLKDRLLNFAVDVGSKMGEGMLSAIGNKLTALPGFVLGFIGPETDFPIKIDLDEAEKRLTALEGRFATGEKLAVTAETGQAVTKLRALQTQALDLKDESERTPILLRIEADSQRLAKIGADVDLIRLSATKPVILPITADTTGVRDKVQAEEKSAIESFDRVSAEFKKLNPNVTFKLDAGQIDAATAKVSALDTAVQKTDGQSADVKITADTTQPTAELATLKSSVDKIVGNISLGIDPSAQAKLDDLQKKAETPATKPIDADTTAANAKVESLASRIAGVLGRLIGPSEASAAEFPAPGNAPQLPLPGVQPTVGPASLVATPSAASAQEAEARRQAADAAERELTAVTAITQQQTVQADTLAQDVARFNELNPKQKISIDTTDIEKASGKIEVLKTLVVGATKTSILHIDANIAGVLDKLGVVEADITAGVDPLTIKAETTAAQKTIDDLKAKIQAVRAEGDKGIELTITADQAKLDAAQGKLNALQANAEKPAVKPVSLDTAQADADLARLNAALDAVAGKSREVGSFDLSGLNSALSSTSGAISSGNADEIRKLLTGLKSFVASNTSATGVFTFSSPEIVQAEQAIQALNRALGVLGVNPLSSGSPLKGDPFATALDDLRRQLSDKHDQQIALQHQANDILLANLNATRDITATAGEARTQQRFVSAITRTIAASTGNRGFTFK